MATSQDGDRQSHADTARKYAHIHTCARRHSTLVTQCCAKLLTHQTQVSDTNYSRGLDEESVAWP